MIKTFFQFTYMGIKLVLIMARWEIRSWYDKFTLEIIYVFPVDIYLLKVNNRNTRTRCEICSKLTIKTPERRSIAHFEKVNTDWVKYFVEF